MSKPSGPLLLKRGPMSLNAVQFDMLCMINRIMRRGKRTWTRHSRHRECELLTQFFNRTISKSWLDDNRGALKRNGFCRAWQHGFRKPGGYYDGSESRRQLTAKACSALSARGIKVFRQVWHALKQGLVPPLPDKPQPGEKPLEDPPSPKTLSKNPFVDPEFRQRHGLQPIPSREK